MNCSWRGAATMRGVQTIRASAQYARAIEAVADLLGKLRLNFAFVGGVARSAWLGGIADAGSVDVLAVMGPQQKSQVAMMGANRGFRVEREELDRTEELDLIPLWFADPDGDVRVHVLVASNALYGRLVASAVPAEFRERTVKIPLAEDFALLLALSGDDAGMRALIEQPAFDRQTYNLKLTSIGLAEHVIR
jgi:hypothetical protein